MMKRKKIIAFVCLAFLLCGTIYGQLPPPPPPIHPELPIDGGISFLLLIGAAFGIYKIKNK